MTSEVATQVARYLRRVSDAIAAIATATLTVAYLLDRYATEKR